MAAQASHLGIEIRTSLPSAGLMIFADGVQLRQVFLDLLLNALEVMPSGGLGGSCRDRSAKTRSYSGQNLVNMMHCGRQQ
ncbi:MAG UNVERIFIED_CONTAM: hypothetical protein LVR18_42270 [Planctomycetaceae bacterium]